MAYLFVMPRGEDGMAIMFLTTRGENGKEIMFFDDQDCSSKLFYRMTKKEGSFPKLKKKIFIEQPLWSRQDLNFVIASIIHGKF